MVGFRSFFISSVKGNHAPTQTSETEKWDVVLFVGDYNPITRDEHERIKQFVAKIIKGDQSHKFCHDVDLGVLVNQQLDEESFFQEKDNFDLSVHDKEFITSKLFGLKMFPVNFKQLMWLTLEQLDRDNTEGASDKIEKISKKIQSSFEKANILIVLRESDGHSLKALGEIIHKFANSDINIGFMVWRHTIENNPIMENLPCDGDIVKSLCLLDFVRPEPGELKSFSYKYKLSNHLDSIRSLHLKCQGEKYLLPFMSVFPDLVIYGDEEFEDKKNNYIFVMEILKKMYLGDEYENKIESRKSEKEKQLTSSGSTSGGGAGPSGSASSGPDSTATDVDSSPENPSADAGAPASTSTPDIEA